MKENLNIDTLLPNILQGDEHAFQQLYYLYFPRLFRFAEKIIQEESLAKDVVQNVFVKVWEKPDCLPGENREAFLYKMVRNASLNYIRHLKVINNLKTQVKDRYLGEELYHIDFIGDQPYFLIEEELQQKIEGIMMSLPEKCQLVFRMSRIDGLKNKEIAEQLQISLKSVEKHISKALVAYRENLSEYLPMQIILLVISRM